MTSQSRQVEIPQYGDASITCAKQYIEYIIARKGLIVPPVPEFCFIAYSADLMTDILARYSHQVIDIGSRNPTRVYFCRPDNLPSFGLISEHLGASMACVVLEELIALGFKKFVSMGTTGHPRRPSSPQIDIGDILLVRDALIYEGTSPHYVPDSERAHADPDLLESIHEILADDDIPFHYGTIATTDALYRETPSFLDNIIERGAVAIDMETSALYTVAGFHKRQICAALYVSDIVEIGSDWDTHLISGKVDNTESIFPAIIESLLAAHRDE